MDKDSLQDSGRYNWLRRASSEQVLLWVHCFKRSNESIDTCLRLEFLERALMDNRRERDRILSEISNLQESLNLMQKDKEENS